MNVLDIVLGALILFGLIRGLMKGLFVEVASLIALIAGVYGAIYFSNFTASFLETRVDWDEKYVNIIAFAITFIIIVVGIAFAGKALTKLADFAALGWINKLLGGIFGGLKIALILSVTVSILTKMNDTLPFVEDSHLEESVLYEPVKSLAPKVFPIILELGEQVEQTITTNK